MNAFQSFSEHAKSPIVYVIFIDAHSGLHQDGVFGLIVRIQRYPDSMGYEAEFKAIVRAWAP
jgi:hypothetical protein